MENNNIHENNDEHENRADDENNVMVIFDGGDNIDEEDDTTEGDNSSSSSDEEMSGIANLADGEQFDRTLPCRHSYLGATQELSGRTVQEDDYISLPLLLHESLMNLVLFPEQTLPMTIFHPIYVSMLKNVIAKDRTFGIVHSRTLPNGMPESSKFGTTAEIYEFQEDEISGGLSFKAKGRQRFKIMSTYREITGCIIARVQILSDLESVDPLFEMRLQSLDKLTLPAAEEAASDGFMEVKQKPLSSVRTRNSWRVRCRNAWMTRWPLWVYQQYDEKVLIQRVLNVVMNATMIWFGIPQMPTQIRISQNASQLSNWASTNLPLSNSQRLTLLAFDSPIQRLRYILSLMEKCKDLKCSQCGTVASCVSDIFCMSVEGSQGTFVNPGGYVHEMFTLRQARGLSYIGVPSSDHSWFPGYEWTIANCGNCRTHLGWKFTAVEARLRPAKFYGLRRQALMAAILDEEEVGEGFMLPVY